MIDFIQLFNNLVMAGVAFWLAWLFKTTLRFINPRHWRVWYSVLIGVGVLNTLALLAQLVIWIDWLVS